MVTLPAKDYAEADAKARAIYNAECDALKCPTPEKERVVKRHSPPMQHADTKVICVIVPDTKFLSAADAAKCVTVAKEDEGKWTPVFTATTVAAPTKG